jgi:hypothetical protein
MILYYSVKNLMGYMLTKENVDFTEMCKELKGDRVKDWVNIGGQLIPASDVDKLRKDIAGGKLDSWQKIHDRYDELWQGYPLQKQKHAFAVMCILAGTDEPDKQTWFDMLDKAIEIQEYIRDKVYQSRQKDYENPFRQATYRNLDEMTAAIGTIKDDGFVKQVYSETDEFKAKVKELKNRG